jgi:hypothetical protein
MCGCTAYTYQPPLENKLIQGQDAKLAKGKGVAVVVPKNVKFEQTEYQKSGTYTAFTIREALMRYTNDVSIVSKYDANDIISSVDQDRYSYVFKPEILHWEERATEWSGKPDRIGIKNTVYDTKQRNVLSSQIFYGKSKWFTFGGDHPQDLLTVPINKYVKSLYEQ